MAVEYVDLACTKAAFVRDTAPGKNNHGAAKYRMAGDDASSSYLGNRLLLAFEDLPETYKYRSLFTAYFKFSLNRNVSSSNNPYFYFHILESDFDESTVTWDTQPESRQYFYSGVGAGTGSGDVDLSIVAYLSSSKDDAPAAALAALRAPGFYLATSDRLHGSHYVDAYAKAAASGKQPYLHIALSDTPAYVKTELVSPEYGDRLDVASPITFSWSLDFLGRGGVGFTEPLAPIVQTSATLRWREKGSEGEWNTISISGDVRSVTVPANTFPARDIQWEIEPILVGYTGHVSDYGTAHMRRFVDMEATGIAGVATTRPDTTIEWTGSFLTTVSDYTVGTDFYRDLLLEFSGFPTGNEHKAIDRAGISFSTIIGRDELDGVRLHFLGSAFDARRVTWNTKPAYSGMRGGTSYDNRGNDKLVSYDPFVMAGFDNSGLPYYDTADLSRLAVECLDAPAFALRAMVTVYTSEAGDANSGKFSIHAPVVRRAMLLDLTVTSKPSATANAEGYVNPHAAQVFNWEHVPDGDYWCAAGWTTRTATLYWRQAGQTGWNTVSVPNDSQTVTIPAETLPVGSVEWYVTATDDQGTTASSEVYTISTTDAEHTATPVYPIDTTENGDAGIRFIWTDSSDTNIPPSGADLQYSADGGASWTGFASPRTSALIYDAPGGSFPAGVLLWRVRSYNADGVAGPWSDSVSFLCFAAPDAPIVTTDGKPFLSVSWQSSGQRAYRVTVDGKVYGPYFGSKKSFSTPDFLTDGQHSVAVEIQNEYSLWSAPGTVSVTVANVPGDPVTLSGRFLRDAELSWSTNDATADFLIYRDGARIGHTSGRSFSDRVVTGYHSWQVINRLPGGYYTASNVVSGTLCTCVMALAPLAGGPWLELELSENPIRTTTASNEQTMVLRQFAGREYPDAEAAPYKNLAVSFDVSFTASRAAQARQFEAMIGREVIFKEPEEEAFVGVMKAWQKRHTKTARSYTATLKRTNWRDYIDADS